MVNKSVSSSNTSSSNKKNKKKKSDWMKFKKGSNKFLKGTGKKLQSVASGTVDLYKESNMQWVLVAVGGVAIVGGLILLSTKGKS